MVSGKKIIKKIQALKDIHGVCVAGNIYNIDELKSLFPYIDFANKDYFKEVYNDKFKIGQRVKYIGDYASTKTTYKITNVSHVFRYDLLYTHYDIVDINNPKSIITVGEDDILDSPSKWIISFSQLRCHETPSVIEVDYNARNGKLKNSWKSWFMFDTKEEATSVARLFKKYTAKDILGIINKFEKEEIDLILKDWDI